MAHTETVPADMQAAVLTGFGGPEALELQRVPVPVPGPGEVLVRVAAAAMNNTDIWTRQGAYGLPGRPDALAGWRGPIEFPRIQGGDISGTVVRPGDDVVGDWVGRRVLVDPAIYDGLGDDANPIGLLGSEADGGFAEYVVARADQIHDVSSSPLTDEQLACLPIAYGTAMGMLERGRLRDRETTLVTGASGGVGLAAVQLAAARGAHVVALTTPDKTAAILDAGAAVVVHRDPDPTTTAAAIAAAVARAAPDGLDAVIDVVGGPLLPAVLDQVRDGGRWVIAGAVGGAGIELDLRRLYLHTISLVGSSMHTRPHFRRLVDDAVTGVIQPHVAHRFSLEAIHAAQEAFARSDYVGKIVLTLHRQPD
ncbi:zinc-binding dehydrogenase [Pseudonocardia sp. RS11V-5]|uniref:zinc-binding dehydrogenase n=1 Tax=Pseudonocardia terrae TaxID=2905831 RepID=UPI001E3169BB|nr:zinc-binding dehydrogenase [Pseudonocardia terrae]MCE3554366.1 zinc-binding dehydrogenase [Pseudonocardia terrae]